MKRTPIPFNKVVQNLLSEIIGKYKEIIQDKLVGIILFGSYAQGCEAEFSDLDILILVDDSDENIKKYDRKLEDINFELTMKYEILISPVMLQSRLFEEYRDSLPFYMNVEKDGIIIYERTAA